MFAQLLPLLRPGGALVANTFLPEPGLEPDAAWRELSALRWSTVFTAEDFDAAIDGRPVSFVSREPVLEFEREHLPAEAWPPTEWYVRWAGGRDLFPVSSCPQSPMRLHWLRLERVAEGAPVVKVSEGLRGEGTDSPASVRSQLQS